MKTMAVAAVKPERRESDRSRRSRRRKRKRTSKASSKMKVQTFDSKKYDEIYTNEKEEEENTVFKQTPKMIREKN
jgi:hypothetical protein